MGTEQRQKAERGSRRDDSIPDVGPLDWRHVLITYDLYVKDPSHHLLISGPHLCNLGPPSHAAPPIEAPRFTCNLGRLERVLRLLEQICSGQRGVST